MNLIGFALTIINLITIDIKMKPKNVSVAIVATPNGVRVWNSCFTLGYTFDSNDEKARKNLQKRIQKFIESIEFPEFT